MHPSDVSILLIQNNHTKFSPLRFLILYAITFAILLSLLFVVYLFHYLFRYVCHKPSIIHIDTIFNATKYVSCTFFNATKIHQKCTFKLYQFFKDLLPNRLRLHFLCTLFKNGFYCHICSLFRLCGVHLHPINTLKMNLPYFRMKVCNFTKLHPICGGL